MSETDMTDCTEQHMAVESEYESALNRMRRAYEAGFLFLNVDVDRVIRRLLAERDALAKDAARYRALKRMADVSDMPDAEEDGSICGQIVYSIVIPTGVDRASHVFREKPLPDMDAAIDAAMEGEK